MSTLAKPASRVAKWDNAKAFLILLVVLGHALASFINNGDIIKWLDLCIYTFHMPLFVFIGGLFSKKSVNSVPFRYEKVVSYLLLSLFMKILNYAVKLICLGEASFSLLSDNSVSWYIFVMAIHLMIAHLVKNCKPWKVLLASTLLAILIGYADEIGNTFVLSRIFVFFPYFYAGYALNPDKVLNVVNKPAVRIVSVFVLIGIFAGLYFTLDTSYFIRRLLTGNNPYYEFGGIWHSLGGVLRICSYALSFVVSTAFLSIIPNKPIPLVTWCGSRTLTVYALHRTVQYFMSYTFLDALLGDAHSLVIVPVLFVISLVLTIVLSLKPFDYILYPCMHWDKILAPVMNWFRKDEYKIKK